MLRIVFKFFFCIKHTMLLTASGKIQLRFQALSLLRLKFGYFTDVLYLGESLVYTVF